MVAVGHAPFGAPRHVRPGGFVGLHPDDHDAMECTVGGSITAAVEAVNRLVFPEGAGSGLNPPSPVAPGRRAFHPAKAPAADGPGSLVTCCSRFRLRLRGRGLSTFGHPQAIRLGQVEHSGEP
jgi:hypothetical protein